MKAILKLLLLLSLMAGLLLGLYLYSLHAKEEDGKIAAAKSDIQLLSEEIGVLNKNGINISKENWVSMVVTETKNGKFQGITHSNGVLLDPWGEAYIYEIENGAGHIKSICLENRPVCSSKFKSGK